ncbi:hypothetical protein CNMCM5793_004952 [Aspergillus hiratsukae]|uniref:ferric-chelate reductase (NADPH) n=1 Tax=Aspergillus hiratsukae TaxID=1194566 RepID=A0A8H6V2F9_9EURO|nr:hypothetical protein CNMCM5793_004952 [Aspergillus hiratsukae]KAF7172889.1 hypothetical protein CNMCM6106_007065 [Aspergillus hiratsukae]
MSVALLTVHIIVAVQAQKFTFPLRDLHNLFTMTAAISVGALALFSIPWFRQWSYEIFLRGHQLLAALFVYGTWQHLEARSGSSKMYFLVALGVFGLTTFLFQLVPLLYRNGLFAGRGYPRAEVSFSIKSNEHNERIDVTAAHVRVSLPRPVQVEAGQYINLWMPAVSLWSWAQTHPFTVTSWAKGPQNTMELLVQPCRGLSAHLARYATKAGETSVSFFALFTGPHGMSEDVRHYESILVIASGFGIAAAIPYMKKMIYGYYTRTLEARRLHLVWQVESRAEITGAEHLLNNLLEDDYKDYGYILNISIYMGDLAMEKLPSGQHKRVCFYQGAPDYRNIISVEASGALIKRQPGDPIKRLTNIRDEQRRTLVMASTTGKNRDRIRETVRSYLRQRVKLSELEYQPTESIH